MDAHCFDDAVRSLTTTASRRGALRLVAGGAVGALLAALGLRDAAAHAGCRHQGKTCDRNSQCCSKRCRHGKCRGCGKLGICAASVLCGAAGSGCECFLNTEGQRTCFAAGVCDGTPCTDDLQCSYGYSCQTNCCTTGVCAPRCGAVGTMVTAAASDGAASLAPNAQEMMP
jgi:hypothetical protein